jgi:hypothetical protein
MSGPAINECRGYATLVAVDRGGAGNRCRGLQSVRIRKEFGNRLVCWETLRKLLTHLEVASRTFLNSCQESKCQ